MIKKWLLKVEIGKLKDRVRNLEAKVNRLEEKNYILKGR